MGVGLVDVVHGLALAVDSPEEGVITRDTVSPGGIGFVLFLILAVGTFILWRSMNKQLKRIDFDEETTSGRNEIDVTDSAEIKRAANGFRERRSGTGSEPE